MKCNSRLEYIKCDLPVSKNSKKDFSKVSSERKAIPSNQKQEFKTIKTQDKKGGKCIGFVQINSFVPNAPFLYLLKTSENLTVHWERMG